MHVSALAQAQQLLGNGQIADAIALLASCTQQEPDNLEALTLLAAATLETGQLPAATQACRTILARAPAHYFAHFILANIAEKEGRMDDALAGYALSYAIHPTHEPPFQAFRALARKQNRLEPFRCRSDIVFVTGKLFAEWGFHGDSLYTAVLGGTESALIAMARELVRLGHGVTVFCNCDDPGTYDGVVYRSNREFAVVNRLDIPQTLVVSRLSGYLDSPTMAGRKILWTQDMPDAQLYKHLESSPLTCDTVFCLSECRRARWQEHLQCNDDTIVVTRNGFSPEDFASTGLPRKPQLIYAGHPSCGLDICLEIFARLRRTRPDLTLAVCSLPSLASMLDAGQASGGGQGDGQDDLRPMAGALRQPGVRWLGALPKPALVRELQQSRLMLCPNTTPGETSCMAALEAMAAGCPVVSSICGALPETVQQGHTGLLVPMTEDREAFVGALADAAEQLLANQTRWDTMSRQARAHAFAHYQWPQIAAEWDALLGSPQGEHPLNH